MSWVSRVSQTGDALASTNRLPERASVTLIAARRLALRPRLKDAAGATRYGGPKSARTLQHMMHHSLNTRDSSECSGRCQRNWAKISAHPAAAGQFGGDLHLRQEGVHRPWRGSCAASSIWRAWTQAGGKRARCHACRYRAIHTLKWLRHSAVGSIRLYRP